MTQIRIDKNDIVERLGKDLAFRKSFAADSLKVLKSAGFDIDQGTLEKAILRQAKSMGNVARTVAIITIF